MSDYFKEFLRAARERSAAPAAPTYAERLRAIIDDTRDLRDERRAKIEALAAEGATEGERAAAQAALLRMDAEDEREASDRSTLDAQDEDDFEDAWNHGAT